MNAPIPIPGHGELTSFLLAAYREQDPQPAAESVDDFVDFARRRLAEMTAVSLDYTSSDGVAIRFADGAVLELPHADVRGTTVDSPYVAMTGRVRDPRPGGFPQGGHVPLSRH